MPSLRALGTLGLALLAAGCATAGPRCAAGTGEAQVRTELAFGLGKPGGGEVTDAEWQAFLDAEVTPRFPDGLTVVAARGQWRDAAGVPVREPSRLLLLVHPPSAGADARIAAVIARYKALFRQESVMRLTGTACVAF